MFTRTFCVILSLAVSTGCQGSSSAPVSLVDGAQQFLIGGESRVPRALIEQAGLQLASGDRVLNRGVEVEPNLPLPDGVHIQLQILRGVGASVNGVALRTAAATVGEVLLDRGNEIGVVDVIEPGPTAPVTADLQITHRSAAPTGLMIDGKEVTVRIGAGGVYAGAADAGVPVIGQDSIWSMESAGLQLARISESLNLVQEPIEFEVEAEDSAELELGLEQVTRAGSPGLKVSRTRVRYQDGIEILTQSEPATIVRPPQNRLVTRGTRVVEKTLSIDGVTFSYWHALQMYATVYSPCNSGTSDGSCSTGTASGIPAGKGVVAVDPGLFAVLSGQRLYIPGYGYAVIGDIGGGYIVEQQLGISRYKWIDLGFDDNDIQDMSGWITVYFLPPAPSVVPEVLK